MIDDNNMLKKVDVLATWWLAVDLQARQRDRLAALSAWTLATRCRFRR